MELAARGLKTLPAVAQKELRRWRNNVFNRWTITTIEKKEYAVTADILEQAIKADPQERDFLRNIGFVAQEWLIATEAKEGLAAAETLVTELAGRFGEIRDAKEVIESFVSRTTFQMIKKKQYDQAQALLDRQQKQLAENTFRDLHREVFESQAGILSNQQKWEETIAVYVSGLKKLPKDKQLTNNLIFTWNSWANTYQKANDWSAAGEVYLKALESGIDKP